MYIQRSQNSIGYDTSKNYNCGCTEKTTTAAAAAETYPESYNAEYYAHRSSTQIRIAFIQQHNTAEFVYAETVPNQYLKNHQQNATVQKRVKQKHTQQQT
ncbi:hypothetical protein P8452_12823 [Trifolium repens]|jgi:hypothetical protein|nr:hypothetical protein QL285_008021 [Trifolium repens]WJX23624.1 hypothetical protein P8452_12823 [Trifolium repens]